MVPGFLDLLARAKAQQVRESVAELQWEEESDWLRGQMLDWLASHRVDGDTSRAEPE